MSVKFVLLRRRRVYASDGDGGHDDHDDDDDDDDADDHDDNDDDCNCGADGGVEEYESHLMTYCISFSYSILSFYLTFTSVVLLKML